MAEVTLSQYYATGSTLYPKQAEKNLPRYIRTIFTQRTNLVFVYIQQTFWCKIFSKVIELADQFYCALFNWYNTDVSLQIKSKVGT